MLTQLERAEINRRNSQFSTGPKSDVGKQRAAFNACRHGLTGQIVVMPAEDLAAYSKFQGSFHDFHKPQGPVETQCVQFMVDASWKLNRSSAWQDQILCQQAEKYDPGINENNPHSMRPSPSPTPCRAAPKTSANFSIYEQRQYRLFEKSHDRLLMLQEQRKQDEKKRLEQAADLLRLHEYEEARKVEQQKRLAAHAGASEPPQPPYVPKPYQPASDGFVYSIDEIKAHVVRDGRLAKAYLVPKIQRAAA